MNEENKLLTMNSIEIIGTLKESKLEVKQNKKDGSNYISGDIVVVSTFDEENTFEINLFSKQNTAEGKESKLYASYANLKNLIGKKIRVSGYIREDRYFNKTTGQMSSFQRLSGRFINAEPDETPDKATFDFGGFVRKGITEKTNKAGEVYAYEIEVAQSNWDKSMMAAYKFNVDPQSYDVINGIKRAYKVNSTVVFGGDIRFITKVNEVKQDSAFGESKVKVYTNTTRSFYITRGDNPIVDETAYSANDIIALSNAYAVRDVQLTSDAGAQVNAGTASVGSRPITSRQTSLI